MSKKGQPKITEITPEILREFRLSLGADHEVNGMLTDFDCERFLCARNFDIPKAREMTLSWFEWYNTPLASGVSPRHILDEKLDKNEHIYQKYMPHSNVGEDKRGNPIYWEETGHISGQFKHFKAWLTEDDLFIRHVRQQELMVKRMEAASVRFGRNIDRQIVVFNLKNLTYSLDPAAMNTFIRTVKVDQVMYPQRLETLYIINAPWFFRALWAVISPWIDPITAAKIKILGGDYLKTLVEAIDIEQIPAEWGGKRENFPWQFPNNFSEAESFLQDLFSSALPTAEMVKSAAATEDSSSCGDVEPAIDENPLPPADLDQQLSLEEEAVSPEAN